MEIKQEDSRSKIPEGILKDEGKSLEDVM